MLHGYIGISLDKFPTQSSFCFDVVGWSYRCFDYISYNSMFEVTNRIVVCFVISFEKMIKVLSHLDFTRSQNGWGLCKRCFSSLRGSFSSIRVFLYLLWSTVFLFYFKGLTLNWVTGIEVVYILRYIHIHVY